MGQIKTFSKKINRIYDLPIFNRYRIHKNEAYALWLTTNELWIARSNKKREALLAEALHWLLIFASDLRFNIVKNFYKTLSKHKKIHLIKEDIGDKTIKPKRNSLSEIEAMRAEVINFIESRDRNLNSDFKDLAFNLTSNALRLENYFSGSLKNMEKEEKNNKNFLADQTSDILYWILLSAYALKVDLNKAFNSHLKQLKKQIRFS